MKPDVRFTRGSAEEEAIRAHLSRCDASFTPALSARVDVAGYARKLRKLAETFEAWDGPSLVGLVAMYLLAETRSAFVTNVSVDPRHTGKGIASRLLHDAIGFARDRGCERASLEVSPESTRAIKLYVANGFSRVGGTTTALAMQLELQGSA